MTLQEFKERAELIMEREKDQQAFHNKTFQIQSKAKRKWTYVIHNDEFQLYRNGDYFLLTKGHEQWLYYMETKMLKQIEIPFES